MLERWGSHWRGVLLVGLGIAALGATIAVPPRPLLVWNATASAPIGLYLVRGGPIARGDMVVARVPARMRSLASGRRYLPAGVPLVKRVVAVPGDTVCALGRGISVDGRSVAMRLQRDGAGRPLPWWSGCRTLPRGSLLLLMAESPRSFDGRYFGPSAQSDVVGEATLLWRR